MQIVFEGIDGSGKSTLASKLEFYLKNNTNKKIDSNLDRTTRPIRMLYRQMISDTASFPSNTTSLFLALADYSQVMSKSVKSDIYIHDRYIYSAIVDFLSLEEKNFEEEEWQSYLERFLLPDYIFLIDIPPEKALERRKGIISYAEAGGDLYLKQVTNDYEQAFRKFQGNLGKNYRKILAMDELNKKVIILNGDDSIEVNFSKVLRALER